MKRVLFIAAVAVLVAVVAIVSPAAADPVSIEVSVEGEAVEDGETFEVDEQEVAVGVTVESENELNTLETSLHNTTVYAGINETRHSTSQILETRAGSNLYTVVAKDLEGNEARFTVDLYREPVTPAEIRDAVESLEERRGSLEDEIDELEHRRDELNRTRQDLLQQVDDGDDEEPDDDGEGLPGFGVFAALVALALVALRR